MSDLISRQEAIDAFKTNGSVFVYGVDVCNAIISRIKLVPSAQPETHDKCTETHDVSFEKQRIVTGPLGELWKKWAKEKDDYSLREYKLKLAYSAGFEDGLRAKREEKEDEQND